MKITWVDVKVKIFQPDDTDIKERKELTHEINCEIMRYKTMAKAAKSAARQEATLKVVDSAVREEMALGATRSSKNYYVILWKASERKFFIYMNPELCGWAEAIFCTKTNHLSKASAFQEFLQYVRTKANAESDEAITRQHYVICRNRSNEFITTPNPEMDNFEGGIYYTTQSYPNWASAYHEFCRYVLFNVFNTLEKADVKAVVAEITAE